MLPEIRLTNAGATPDEMDHIRQGFERSSPSERDSIVGRLEKVADSGVREFLDEVREGRYFGEIEHKAVDLPADSDAAEQSGEAGGEGLSSTGATGTSFGSTGGAGTSQTRTGSGSGSQTGKQD